MRFIQKSFLLLAQISVFSLIFAFAQTPGTQPTRTEARQQRRADDALLRACQEGDITLAKATLKAGANVNVQNSDGNTPLMFAAQKDNEQLIDLLLQSGAKAIMQNDKGENAIDFLPVRSTAIEKRLQAKIDYEKPLSEQLIQAIFDNNSAKALAFLAQGAYIDFIDKRIKEYATPLTVALDRRNFELAKAFLKAGARIERADNLGRTPLFYAMKRLENFKLLLDAGANINATLKDGGKPIMVAATSKNIDIVQLLIDAGADVNSADLDGESPLYYAAKAGDGEMIKFLLSKNANANKENKFQANLLHIAIDTEYPELVPILLKSGVDPNKKADKGYTPLMVAAGKGDLASTNLLLQNGVDTYFINDNGDTALTKALKSNQTQIIAVLQKTEKAQPTTPTVSELKKEASERMKKIDSDQTTLMMEAVSKKNNAETVLYLLKAGFPPNVKNEKGETPLMIATDHEDMLVMGLLLDYSADINAQDNEGMTPLMRAVAKDLNTATTILLEKGAKKNIKDKKGRTALSIAKEGTGILMSFRLKELEY